MKILGISGSPRKAGNTTILIEEALKAISARATTEAVTLADLASPGHLPTSEALRPVVAKMVEADAILIGTPSYFAGPSAAMKALWDETWEAAKAKKLAGKPGAAFVVESATGGELAAQSVAHFLQEHHGLFLGYVVARGLKEREVLFDIKAIREARDLATRVVDHVERRAKA